MSRLWSLFRRYPFVILNTIVWTITGIADGSGGGIGAAIFLIVVGLVVSWIFRAIRRTIRNRRSQPPAARTEPQPSQLVQSPAPTPSKSVNQSPLTSTQRSEAASAGAQPISSSPGGPRPWNGHEADLRRSEEARRARQAEFDRQTAELLSPQTITHMSPGEIASQTKSEAVTPPGQSAFVETAHRPLPASPRKQSALPNIRDLLALTPTEFEEFCADALRGIGYSKVERVGRAGDLAADITATDNLGRSVVVQCKRYKPGTKVGSPALQTFIGMKSVHHEAERGIYMTTADYSIPAVRLAKQHDIVLIDGDDLTKIAGLVLMPKRAEPKPTTVGRFCANCGVEFTESGRFCTSCGAAR